MFCESGQAQVLMTDLATVHDPRISGTPAAGSEPSGRVRGEVEGCGVDEEADNLRAIDMLHDVLNSFAKQSSYERGNQRASAEGSQESVLVRFKLGGVG